MADWEASVKFKADSTEFNSAIKSASAQVREMQSALKLNAEQMKTMGTSADSLTQREKLLAQEAEALAAKKAALADKLKLAEECFGADSTQASSLRTQLSGLETQSVRVEAEMSDVNAQLQAQREAAAKAETATEQLSGTISSQEKELEELKKQYVEAVLQYGKNSKEAKSLGSQISSLSGELKENEKSMSDAEKAAAVLDQTTEEAAAAAKKSAEGWTTFKGVIADLASEAIQAAINALRELASEVMETGIETETAFAKLETISGADAIDDLTDSMRELSTETGVSAAELADVAYNAISAGSSAEEAADVVEAATKLGVAGFADTSDALSILSTAMNSYGDEAGTVEEISDSLIQVQNLGVTTIGELASGMGKAISTASAYSVNLGNLESAYVSLTKAGISTEESTTYLSSMLNELGDSGSGVSAILQEQTGKSFTELMEDGYSLSDVLGILYDSVDGDSTALMNLWSSADAGKASNAIVNQGLETFNENLEAITDSAGATESAYETMADTTETKLAIMEQSFADLGLSIFEGLEEPLDSAIGFVTDTVIPAIKTLMDNFDTIAPIITAAAAAFVAYKTAMSISSVIETVTKATQGMSVAQAALNAVMNANPIAIVVALLAGLVTAIVTLWNTNEDFRNAVTEIWEGFKSTVSGVVDAVTGFFSNLGESAGNLVSSIADGWNDLTGKASSIWSGITGTLSGAWDSIKSTASTAVTNVATSVSTKWNAIKSTTSTVFNGVKSVASTAWSGIKSSVSNTVSSVATSVSTKWNAIKSTTSTVFSGVKSAASTAWSGIKSVISNGASGALSTVTSKFNSIKSSISGVMDSAKNTVSNAISKIKSFFNFTWSLPKLKMPHITIKGKFSLSPLSVPSFSISWYKEGGVLNAATIFGASGSSLLGGGEAGPEAVAPIDVLQSYVAAAVDRSLSDSLSQVAQAIEALAQRPIYLNVNGKTFAAATAGDFDTALGSRQALSARGLCL
ncbi:MAG: phage tail tape measure protein [Clostridiales bacterium]|nr:phage tail tape measure protein [Clostridiales bacterium]